MLREERERMVAKPFEQDGQIIRSRRVRPQFEDSRGAANGRLHLGRKIRRLQKRAFDLGHELSVGLGFGGDLLPLGIVSEFLPLFVRGFPARERQDVDEFVLGIVDWNPITEARHTVFLEDLLGVIAKACVEIVEFPGSRGVDAQLEAARIGGRISVEHRGRQEGRSDQK